MNDIARQQREVIAELQKSLDKEGDPGQKTESEAQEIQEEETMAKQEKQNAKEASRERSE